MTSKKTVFVCGTFNGAGGKRSSICDVIYHSYLSSGASHEENTECIFVNGGTMAELDWAWQRAADAQVVIWWADIPNEEAKSKVRTLKVVNPTCVLVTSKRVVENQYEYPQVIAHGLALHSNLIMIFRKHTDGRYMAELFDPLGNTYADALRVAEFDRLGRVLRARVEYLRGLVRMRTEKAIGSCPETVPDQREFLDIIHAAAVRFDELIPKPTFPVYAPRFVGNAAFRCSYGFPAIRVGHTYYVSRRNVDKTHLGMSDFVPIISQTAGALIYCGDHKPSVDGLGVRIACTRNELIYCGDHKPSVDAPIQGALFDLYPDINFLLHGHVYVAGAPTTTSVIPCGALNEAQVVWQAATSHDTKNFVLNLRGHGFIAGSNTPKALGELLTRYVARPLPEDQSVWTNATLLDRFTSVEAMAIKEDE